MILQDCRRFILCDSPAFLCTPNKSDTQYKHTGMNKNQNSKRNINKNAKNMQLSIELLFANAYN